MGDNRRIDMLRALALSSMPSVSRRPMQRQNSHLINVTDEGKSPFFSCPAKSDDKEEGELSSDDEAQCSSTPFPLLEPSVSVAHRNTTPSLYAPSQGNWKDLRHTPAAVSADSVPPIGAPRASVSSPSTRVSIVNKSQLLSAFTAQAPLFKSFQRPKPAQNGSVFRTTENKSKKKLPQVTPSGAGLGSDGLGLKSSPNSLEVISTTTSQAKSNSLEVTSTTTSQVKSMQSDLSLFQENRSVLSSELINQAPEPRGSGEPLLQFPADVPSRTLTSSELPVPFTVTNEAPPVLGSATTSVGQVRAGQESATSTAFVHGLEVSRATVATVTVPTTSGIGGVGVRKEADAFLASLRIPVLNSSSASGEEKEDAFLIKFDEDSDSDGVEHENRSNPSSKHPNRSSQKGSIGSSGPLNSNVTLQLAPVMPNQSPSDLKAEIDRMKKQIALMERTKGKASAHSILGKSSKVASDNTRHLGASATEYKTGVHSGVVPVRPASVDLESMRLRIAAKENELLQRRQRLAIKGPECGKGVSDLRGTSCVVAFSMAQSSGLGHTVDVHATHAIHTAGKASEKTVSGYRQARVDGVPALSLAGSGVTLPTFKRDGEKRGLDGSNDPQSLKDQLSQLPYLAGATNGTEEAGHQSVGKGIKRSITGGEQVEIPKVPRLYNGSLSEKSGQGDFVSKVVAMSNGFPSKGISTFMPSSQTSSLLKRKADATDTSSNQEISIAPAGLEAVKKLKTSTGILPFHSTQDVMAGLPVNSQPHTMMTGQQTTQTLSPLRDDVVQSSILLVRDQGRSASASKTSGTSASIPSESLKKTAQSWPHLTNGTVGNREARNSTSISVPLPAVTENWGCLIAVQRNPQDSTASSRNTQSALVNGDEEAFGTQQSRQGFAAYHGPAPIFTDSALTSGLTHPTVEVSDDKQSAYCTTVTFAEQHPKTQGTSNVNHSVPTENDRLQDSLAWKAENPVSVHASTNLEHQVRCYSRIDDEQLDAERDGFQQLLEEEELLDREIEEARQNRQRCELKERAVRKEYRNAQWALRAANADCDILNQKKELLLSRIHAAEARHYSIKSSIPRPMVSFNTLVTHYQSIAAPATPLEQCLNVVPVVRQAAVRLCEVDVNGDQDHCGHALDSLGPLSSNRADVSGLGTKEVQFDLSTKVVKEYSNNLSIMRTSDPEEDGPALQMTTELDCGTQMEDDGAFEGDVVQRADALKTNIVVDVACHDKTDYFASCRTGLNRSSEHKVCTDLEKFSLGTSSRSTENQNGIASTMCSLNSCGDRLPEGTIVEIKEKMPQEVLPMSMVDCSKQCTEVVSVGLVCSLARLELSAILPENDLHPSYTRSDGPIVADLNSRDLEHHDLEKISNLTECQDAQSADLLQSVKDTPSTVQGVDCSDNQDVLNMKATPSPAQGVDCSDSQDILNVQDNPSAAQNVDFADPQHIVNLGEGNGLGKDDLSAQGQHRNQNDSQDSEGLKDNSVYPTFKYTDRGDHCSADEQCFTALMVRKVGDQVAMPEKLFLTEQDTVQDHECEVAKVLYEPNDKGDSEMWIFTSCDTALPHENTEVQQEPGNVNLRPLSKDAQLRVLPSEVLQSSIHLSHSTCDPQVELDTNSDDKEVSERTTLQAHSYLEAGVPMTITDSPMNSGLKHSRELEEFQGTTYTSPQSLYSGELQSAVDTHDPPFLDLDIHVRDAFNTPDGLPGVLVGKVELLSGMSQSKTFSASESGDDSLGLLEDLKAVGSREEHKGISIIELQDLVSGQSCGEPPPGAVHICIDDPLNRLGEHSKPPLEGVSNVSNMVIKDGCTLVEQEDPADEAQHGMVNSVNISGVLDSRIGDATEGEVDDLCKESKMITENKGATAGAEIQEHEAAQDMEIEDQQQDLLNMDPSISGELKSEEAEKQESGNGAEVEVFRKALLDRNVLERRSSSEVKDGLNSQGQCRDEVSEQILPQLQHHRLEHLLDMVEVRAPAFSVGGGDALVQEELQGAKCDGTSLLVEGVLMDTTVECHKSLLLEQVQASEVNIALPSGTPKEITHTTLGNRVPLSASLAICVGSPRESQQLNRHSLTDKVFVIGDSDEHTLSGATIIPCQYESPLSVFRSYRRSPQFSSALHLSSNSSTWSHAINPFKPLCKFEHRGKCNNNDCPWQHADDYTLTSSQLVGQLQNSVDPSGLNFDDHGLPIACSNNGALAATSPTLNSSVTGVSSPQLHGGAVTLTHSSMFNSSLVPNLIDNGVVPVYRSGSYTLRAVDPISTILHPYSLHLDRKVDSFHSFLLSPSIHRQLPVDMPCLLDSSNSLLGLSETTAFGTESSHWRYMAEMPDKLVLSKDGFMEGLVDEEVWLEMALHHIDFDISIDNSKARDQALFILSRALESKPGSVTLWMVYSCLFHTRKDNPEKDDMFRHAVQYTQGSYELWLLYINSRPDLQSKLEAYEKALAALVYEGTQTHFDKDELSACTLDLGLQMLYCMHISGHTEDLFLWLDDLVWDATVQNDQEQRRGSTTALLSHLTLHDACVLWIACTYFSACEKLPNSIIAQLGCKQELPYGLDWENQAKSDELSRVRVIKMLNTAASAGQGCLSLEAPQVLISSESKDHDSKQVLAMNYLRCVALYEGLDLAARLGHRLRNLYPMSLDLVLICASIDERRSGASSGLHIFDEAVLQWPSTHRGILCLWNQYARHGLLWVGKNFARDILLKCVASAHLHSSDQQVSLPPRFPKPRVQVCKVDLDGRECKACEECSMKRWGHLRDDLINFTSTGKTNDQGNTCNFDSSQIEDSVFSLITLALVEAISGDLAATQLAIYRAMKAAISYKGLRNCWRELSALHQVLNCKFVGWEDSSIYEPNMLSLIDRCKTDSHILSQLIPLSHKPFMNFRKPYVRKFIEDLVGPPPFDHSILNSILDALYGPDLLPSTSHSLKEVFSFAEGILEAMPGNVQLALSLCEMVKQHDKSLKRTYKSTLVWASALFTSSLHQSCPLAPEFYWVEAGLLLRQVGEERSLEEFYLHALMHYPFSVALRHALQDLRSQLQITDTVSQNALQKSLTVVMPELVQVGVEC